MIKYIFQYTFLQNAVLSALLASTVCGIMGTIIIEKKLVMMSGGIAHASFGGIGMGYFLDIEPIIGGLIFAVIASLGISSINRITHTNQDAITGMFWSAGMATGILFIAITPGYPPDMISYLFGDILTVSTTDIILMLLLSTIITTAVIPLFNYWKAYLFDLKFTSTLGVKITFFEHFLFLLIGLTTIVTIRVVGIILTIALLTIPPSIAKLFTLNLKNIMIVSVLLGIIFCMSGLVISYYSNIPSGSIIVLLSSVSYFIATTINKFYE